MELGGNAPFIVFEDADIDAAIEGAMIAKMRNMGEACTAANRFYVHEKVHDEFAKKLTDKMAALKMGNGLDDGVALGPLVNEEGRDKVIELVDDAVQTGAKVLTGGKTPDGPGYLLSGDRARPTCPDGAKMLNEEIFGPVASIQTFKSEDEAIQRANDTEYGLVAYLYTKDLSPRHARVRETRFGMIGLNRGSVSDPAAPFGGTKQSGLGREGAHEGMLEFHGDAIRLGDLVIAGRERETAMDVLMPQLGETVAEGKISKWFVSAGDAVKPGQNLFEIETDKVSMEVPAIAAGTLAAIHVQSGETAPVGAVVAIIQGKGEAVSTAKPQAPATPQAPLMPAKAGIQSQERTGSPPSRERAEVVPNASRCQMEPFREVRSPERNFGPARLAGGTVVTPLARRLAGEAGIDLTNVKGSGPHGRIVARDVETARKAPAPAQAAASLVLTADIALAEALALCTERKGNRAGRRDRQGMGDRATARDAGRDGRHRARRCGRARADPRCRIAAAHRDRVGAARCRHGCRRAARIDSGVHRQQCRASRRSRSRCVRRRPRC